MKQTFFFLMVVGLLSCNQRTENGEVLQSRIDSLQHDINNSYKPGFGDLMGTLQIHHSKLWFAGQNENWPLADFEIHEISEAIDDIKAYQRGRKETKMIDLLQPSLHKIDSAIQQKDPELFRRGYTLMTATCNSCHHETDHGFVVVKTPDTPPFSNQDFRVQSKE